MSKPAITLWSDAHFFSPSVFELCLYSFLLYRKEPCSLISPGVFSPNISLSRMVLFSCSSPYLLTELRSLN